MTISPGLKQSLCKRLVDSKRAGSIAAGAACELRAKQDRASHEPRLCIGTAHIQEASYAAHKVRPLGALEFRHVVEIGELLQSRCGPPREDEDCALQRNHRAR